MEFLHGAIRSKNKNACFFIRKPESLNELPEEYKGRFFDSDDLAKCHLTVNQGFDGYFIKKILFSQPEIEK
jgi:hypothetical protein